jgi:hypothetical protein
MGGLIPQLQSIFWYLRPEDGAYVSETFAQYFYVDFILNIFIYVQFQQDAATYN